MFDKLRRIKQQMDKTEVYEILENASYGVLSVIDENGYPYTVPLNYVFHDDKLYFHSAVEGHKIKALENSSKVSFNIVYYESVVPEKLSTKYKSVTVFGKGSIVNNPKEKADALKLISLKYAPEYMQNAELEINNSINRTSIIRVDIEHVSGKFHD